MTSDPRLAYRTLAAAALGMILFFIHYLASGLPDEFYSLFSTFYMAAYGAAEVYYDSRRKVKGT